MARLVRTALGDIVDFDLLAIKQQLASAQPPKVVEDRKVAIDEKDGVRTSVVPDIDFLAVANEAAAVNARGAAARKK
jgi:hypothetical protein